MNEGDEITSADVRSIRSAKGWSRAEMAKFLGCYESTVWRMENGHNISGPVQRLLQNLKNGIGNETSISTTCTEDGTWIALDRRTGLAHSGGTAEAAIARLRKALDGRVMA